MENELKEGDVVMLKSGGPKMTVETIGQYDYENKAYCTWFDGNKKVSDLFKLEALALWVD